MKKKLLVLATILSVGALVGCKGKATTSSSASVATSQVASSVEASSAQASSSETTVASSSQAAAASSEVASSQVVSSSEAAPILNAVGSESEPATVDAAIEEALKIQKSDYDNVYISKVESYIVGIVKSVKKNDKYENCYIIDMVVDANSTKALTVYNGTLEEGVEAPCAGDEIKVKGLLENFNGTAELMSAKYLSSEHKTYTPTFEKEHIASITAHTSILTSGSKVEFNITPEEGYKIIEVTFEGKVITPNESGAYEITVGLYNNFVITTAANDAVIQTKTIVTPAPAANAAGLTATGSKVTELITGDDNVKVKATVTSGNNSKIYGTISSGQWGDDCNWRFYAASPSGAFEVSCTFTIEKMKITFDVSDKSAKLMYGEKEVVSAEEFEVNAKSATFTASVTGNVRVKEIVVFYTVEDIICTDTPETPSTEA